MSTDAAYFGIDFGTTYSSMAWYNPETNQAEILLNAEGEPETPSLVYFGEDDEVLVGKPVENLIEESEHFEEEERLDVALRVVRSIKRGLIHPPATITTAARDVRPVEVVAEIFEKLKRDAESEHFEQEVDRVVITCPAVFSSQEWQVLFDAGIMAGFSEVERIQEPIAAALTVAKVGQTICKGVLVYDLGAGRFDLSLAVRDDKDGSFYMPVGSDVDHGCGGDVFDRLLYDHCDGIARERLGRTIGLTDEVDQSFLRLCRSRKEILSRHERSVFMSFLPSGTDPVPFRHEVSRKDFEDLIRDPIENTSLKTFRMLQEARERGYEVDAVLLIGGASRIPLVRQLVGQIMRGILPAEARNLYEEDYSVVRGAAYRAHELWKPKAGGRSRKKTRQNLLDEYRRAVEREEDHGNLLTDDSRHRLNALAASLDLQQTAAIEKEVLGDTVAAIVVEHNEIRRLLRMHDLSLSQVTGTGEGGKVTRRDVELHIEVLEELERQSLARERNEPEAAKAALPRGVQEMLAARERLGARVSRLDEKFLARCVGGDEILSLGTPPLPMTVMPVFIGPWGAIGGWDFDRWLGALHERLDNAAYSYAKAVWLMTFSEVEKLGVDLRCPDFSPSKPSNSTELTAMNWSVVDNAAKKAVAARDKVREIMSRDPRNYFDSPDYQRADMSSYITNKQAIEKARMAVGRVALKLSLTLREEAEEYLNHVFEAGLSGVGDTGGFVQEQEEASDLAGEHYVASSGYRAALRDLKQRGIYLKVFALIKVYLADSYRLDEIDITADTSFREDLSLDSLDLAELLMEAEEQFGMLIPDEDAEKLTTVEEAARYIVNERS